MFIYDWSFEIIDNYTMIRIYGLDSDGKTIVLNVKDFLPYFYLELPDNVEWTSASIRALVNMLNEKQIFQSHQPPLSLKLRHRKKLYYVQPKDNYPYLMCRFATNDQFRTIRNGLIQRHYVKELDQWVQLIPHETNASPLLQLSCEQNIPMAGWIDFKGEEIEPTNICHKEYEVSYRDIHPVEKDGMPEPMVLSFDIECYSSNSNKMPQAEKETDAVFQISCVFWQGGTQYSKYLLTLGKPSHDVIGRDSELLTYDNESELLIGFVELIRRYNPHIITGYNILGFDMPYMMDRAELFNLDEYFCRIGMVKDKVCAPIDVSWSSSAYGNQHFRYIQTDGRIFMDLLIFARREFKFDNYKLETVASHFVDAHKDPITPKDIFQGYKEGVLGKTKDGIQLLGEVGKYCIQDSVLVARLFKTFDTWYGLMEMAKVCNVQASVLYTKGQQIKVFSQVYKYCYDNKIVVETDGYKPDGTEEYQGALVKEPKPAVYHNVVPFDFSSLYPSVIIAYNIDYSTLVTDDSISDDLCHVIEWMDEEKSYRYRFLKKPAGVIPTIAQNLLNARKNTRKEIKHLKELVKTLDGTEKETTEVHINILNKRQLSYKVSVNSMYGSMGVRRGYLPFMPGAMATTAMGRYNLTKAQRYLEDKYQANVIYSDTDSCYCLFPHVPDPVELWKHCYRIDEEMIRDKVFPPAIRLAFEEVVYNPFLILSKKRYMYTTISPDGVQNNKIGQKGILLARRDNSKFIRDVYRQTVDNIFHELPFEDTMYNIIQAYNKCCSGSLPQDDFIITKSIKDVGDGKVRDGMMGEYKIRDLPTDTAKREKRLKDLHCTLDTYPSRALPAVVQLAERMRRRGKRVEAGQRVEYVVTMNGGLKAKLFDKVEDPDYQKQFSTIIPLDYLYYIHLSSTPLDQLLQVGYERIDKVKEQYKLRLKRHQIHEELYHLFRPVLHKSIVKN